MKLAAWECDEEGWQDDDDADGECFLAVDLQRMYDAELSVHERLRDHWGAMVPELLGVVEMRLDSAAQMQPGDGAVNPFRVKGLLLQYSPSLGDVKSIVYHFRGPSGSASWTMLSPYRA